MYTDSTLKPIYDHQPYNARNGTQYPANHPKAEIPGLFLVTETSPPTDPNLIVTGFIIDNTRTQIWQTREKTENELAGELRLKAISALSKSDIVMNRIGEGVSLGLTKWAAKDVMAYVRYRRSVRAIAGGAPGPLPDQPAYPKGT